MGFLEKQYALFKPRNITEIADAVEEQANDNNQRIIAALGIGKYLRRHPDHITTRKVALELLERGREVLFYADIPYSLPIRNFDAWPARINEEKMKRLLGVDVEVESIELTRAQQLRKQKAVQAFTSQYKAVSYLALGALEQPDAYRWEALIKPV